jgi:flavin reductase
MAGGDAEALSTPEVGFRSAMRRLAGTVTVVTVDIAGERHGTTATAVTSLSMAPPSLLVCFNRDSRLHALLSSANHFCVNLLHTDNVEVSKRFASPLTSAERFAFGAWSTPEGGAPALADAQSSIQCIKDQQVDYGSHTIFIGRVTQVINREDVQPLIYCNGVYGGASPLTPSR